MRAAYCPWRSQSVAANRAATATRHGRADRPEQDGSRSDTHTHARAPRTRTERERERERRTRGAWHTQLHGAVGSPPAASPAPPRPKGYLPPIQTFDQAVKTPHRLSKQNCARIDPIGQRYQDFDTPLKPVGSPRRELSWSRHSRAEGLLPRAAVCPSLWQAWAGCRYLPAHLSRCVSARLSASLGLCAAAVASVWAECPPLY